MKNWQQILLTLKMLWWQLRDTFSTLLTRRNPLSGVSASGGASVPIPPAHLRVRVGDASADNYLVTGPRVYRRLKIHLAKYKPLEEFDHVLDWGCGCGRVTRFMLESVPATRLYGCDVDPDAIAWLQEHFPESSFTTIRPVPPTPFDDVFFDLIYGISVFTHLDETMQFRWLEELRRITRVDGIVAVTVHDDTSTDTELKAALDDRGFSDREGDRSVFFRHFLDDGYYRLTKHSKDYVMREWSKYFDILDFIEKGIGRQNLVIMRRSQ